MKNFWLRRKALLKEGNLAEWNGYQEYFVDNYGSGPFRVLQRMYSPSEDDFYYLIEDASGGGPTAWVPCNVVIRYRWEL